MDAVGSDGQGDLGAGVYQEGSSLLCAFAQGSDGFAGYGFQFARGEIFFAELNVVDTGTGSFGDFLQKAATARGFVSRKRGAVSDVVEKAT